jgi:lysophospholipase L1-like esterase
MVGIIIVAAEVLARALSSSPSSVLDRWEKSEAYSYFDWSERYLRDARSLKSKIRSLQYEPYSLWKGIDFETETINVEGGYRRTWQPPGPASDRDRLIVVFGGSTLFGGEVPDDLTIPSLLAKELAERDPVHRYVVRNLSASGFINDNELHLHVEMLFTTPSPHAVLFYDGFNDVYNKVAVGEPHYLYKNFQGVVSKPGLREMLVAVLSHSRVASLFLEPPSPKYILDGAIVEARVTKLMAKYRSNMRAIKALAASYGFVPLFFWQPDIFSTGKTLTDEEARIRAQEDKLGRVFHQAHSAMVRADFTKEEGLINLRDTFEKIDESIFLDPVHVTSIGNQAIARAMATELLKALDARETR